MSKPLIALMQPAAGRSAPDKHAVRAFYRPSKRGLDRRELEQGTSMLTRCFNLLWAQMLNEREKLHFTHVAMLHNDVVPSDEGKDGWLDILYDEIEATDADMVSAVVPIKSSLGVTSTAVASASDDWWVRRLTMREVFHLPETFGAEDVPWRQPGMALLPNTGCWIAKLGASNWVERFADHTQRSNGQSGFTFENRIIRDPISGQWFSQDRSEDWLLGRILHSYGLKVLCTRKVPLYHGQPEWHTREAWGSWPTDLAYLEWQRTWNRPRLDIATPPEWKFPVDVEGWLSQDEGKVLANLAQGKTVLEIGSYCGLSTICLAQTADTVHVVDTFMGTNTTKPQYTLPKFVENLSRYDVAQKVRVYEGTSATMVPGMTDRFDLAFIDGSHDYEAVLQDARLATMVLKPGGLLAFHDYQRPIDPEVTKAVDELISRGMKKVQVADTIAVLQPCS